MVRITTTRSKFVDEVVKCVYGSWEKEVGISGLLGTIDLVDSNDEVTVGWLDVVGIVSAEADFVG